LAKQPDQRFATCVAFSDALRRAVINKEITATLPVATVAAAVAVPLADVPIVKPPSSPLVKAGLAIGLGIAVAAIFIVRSQNQPAPVVTASEPAKPVAPVATVETKQPDPIKPAPMKDVRKKETPMVAAAPPPVAENRPAEAPDPSPDAPAASYNGPPEGRFSWSGVFGPGERLVIVRNRVRKGSVGGSGLPPGIPLQVEASPADVKVVQQPNAANGFRLVVANSSGAAVSGFSIVWRELQH